MRVVGILVRRTPLRAGSSGTGRGSGPPALHAVLATFIKSGWGRSSLTLCVSTMTVELESRTNPAGALSRSARRNALRREQRRPARVIFRDYAREYLAWAKLHHRGWRTEASRISVMVEALGDVLLDALTHADVEKFLDGLLVERTQSTRNRYRTLLHAMLNRARRYGHLPGNPVQEVAKFKEPEGRIKFVMLEEEQAIREALRPELRPLFTASVHTGLRWSEQLAL